MDQLILLLLQQENVMRNEIQSIRNAVSNWTSDNGGLTDHATDVMRLADYAEALLYTGQPVYTETETWYRLSYQASSGLESDLMALIARFHNMG